MVARPAPLNAAELQRINAAIAAAESRTSGEIFVVVARESDDYRFVPLAWALLIALAVPLPLVWFTPLPAIAVYAIELVVFIVAALVLWLPQVKPWVVPAYLKRQRTRALAEQQFLAHGIDMTEARTGVLVFVSLAERGAEIVADAGIAARVPQATWDAAMAALVAAAASGHLADGLVAAVSEVGRLLAEHFPPRPLNVDEIANDVVIL